MPSIVDDVTNTLFQKIHVRLECRGRLVGGNPRDPHLVTGWLRKNMGVTDQEEINHRLRTHLVEMGVEDVPRDASYDDLVAAAESIAEEFKTQGFKRAADGSPLVESRQIKAAIKECVNILYANLKWGPGQGKGPKGYTAERVFVGPTAFPIGREDDVGVDLFVGHVNGRQGPRSTIGYYEYVENAVLEFHIRQLMLQNARTVKPAIPAETWMEIFTLMQENGIGAMRSQGFGTFDLTRFEVCIGAGCLYCAAVEVERPGLVVG